MIELKKIEVEPTIEDINKVCLSYLNTTNFEIFYKTRKHHVVINRQIFYFLAKRLTKLSYISIIKYTNKNFNYSQNHATLVHAMKTIDNLCETDRSFNLLIKNIKQEIKEMYGCTLAVKDVNLLQIAIKNTHQAKEELFKNIYKYES